MDQETDVIKKRIDHERDQLTRNLQEMKFRISDATSPRSQFNKNPLLGLGLAFAGGFLVAMITGGDKTRSESRSLPETRHRSSIASSALSKLSGTINNISEALFVLGSTKLASLIADVVPGFHQEYEKVERKGVA